MSRDLFIPQFSRESDDDASIYYARLQQRYQAFLAAGDMANAVTCWDAMEPIVYDFENAARPFDCSLPAIISAFMPKSGGTFLHNRLQKLFGYREHFWCIVNPNFHSACLAAPNALARYLRGGCTMHTHFLPTHPQITQALDKANVRRIWVHLRDPRFATASAFDHYKGEGQGEGAIAEQRRAATEKEIAAIGIGHLLEGDAGDAFFSETFEFLLLWVSEWLEFSERNPGVVWFSLYDDLSNNPVAFFEKLVGIFGIDRDRFRTKIHDSSMYNPESPDRISDVVRERWDDGLSRKTIIQTNKKMDILRHRFPRCRFGEPGASNSSN